MATSNPENSYLYSAYCGFLDNPYVQEGYKKYESAKHSHPLLQNSLQTAENIAGTGRAIVLDTATTAYRRLYTQPKEKVEKVYTAGVETTKNIVNVGKDTAAKCGTLTIGAGVLAGQVTLAATAASASLVIDGVDSVKSKSADFIAFMERKIWEVIYETLRILKIPIDFASEKFLENANSLLDATTGILEKTLGLNVPSGDDSSLRDRVKRIAVGIFNLLTAKAHDQVIDPITGQVHYAVESLSKNLALVDQVRENGKWATGKVQTSLSGLKTRIETEAANLKVRPEELLMKGIHSSNKDLQTRLSVLREKGNQFLGEGNNLDGVIVYLQELETTLGEAEDIYAIQDEVLEELKKRLDQLSNQWHLFRQG